MIFVIDGPNGSGKSTVMRQLKESGLFPRDTYWVSFPHRHFTDALLFAVSTEIRSMEVFTALHRYEQTYVFDRLWPLTSVVYARLRGEPVPDLILNPPWIDDLLAIGLFDTIETLYERVQARTCCRGRYTKTRLAQVMTEYERRLEELPVERVLITNSQHYASIHEFVKDHLGTQASA